MKKVIALLVFGVFATVAAPVILSQGPVRQRLHNLIFRDAGPAQVCANGTCATVETTFTVPAAPQVATATAPVALKSKSVAAGAGEQMFHSLVKIRVTNGLVRQGYSRSDARAMASTLTPHLIDGAMASVAPDGAIGDGTILKALLDFLASPAGQQLIQLLISILLGGA